VSGNLILLSWNCSVLARLQADAGTVAVLMICGRRQTQGGAVHDEIGRPSKNDVHFKAEPLSACTMRATCDVPWMCCFDTQ
jgi:hypothetical protein